MSKIFQEAAEALIKPAAKFLDGFGLDSADNDGQFFGLRYDGP